VYQPVNALGHERALQRLPSPLGLFSGYEASMAVISSHRSQFIHITINH
jgi:hypothetical protein